MVKWQKKQFDYDFFFHGVICVKSFEKFFSGFTLTERRKADNYNIIFWSVTSKSEFSIN